MFRTLVSLLFPMVIVAAPALKPKPSYYHPMRIGDKRVYEVTQVIGDGILKEEYSSTVVACEQKDTGYLLTSRCECGSAVPSEQRVFVNAKGMFHVHDPHPNVCFLQLPAKKGTNWCIEIAERKNVPQQKQSFEIMGEEEIEVPAGRFKAIRVDKVIESEGTTTKFTAWYACGVGAVKQYFESPASKMTTVLKSFTPGK